MVGVGMSFSEQRHELARLLLQATKGKMTRVKILQALQDGSKNCNQLSQYLKLNWKSIRYHLKILGEADLIDVTRLFQRTAFYRLTEFGETVLGEVNLLSIKEDTEKL